MESFELLSIPRFLGNETKSENNCNSNDLTKSEAILKLINDSKNRKKLRTNSVFDNEHEIVQNSGQNITDESFERQLIAINNNNEIKSESIEDSKECEEKYDEECDDIHMDSNQTEFNSNDFTIIGEVKKESTKK